MKLSTNFTLEEFINSPTALRLGIDNTPNQDAIVALRQWCDNIGEPVRAHFHRPVKIYSGYRCLALNRAVGGSIKSQHMQGEAVDFGVIGIPHIEVARFIAANLVFDQLIAEYLKKASPMSGWVHCSYRQGQLRGDVLSCINKGKYVKGIIQS